MLLYDPGLLWSQEGTFFWEGVQGRLARSLTGLPASQPHWLWDQGLTSPRPWRKLRRTGGNDDGALLIPCALVLVWAGSLWAEHSEQLPLETANWALGFVWNNCEGQIVKVEKKSQINIYLSNIVKLLKKCSVDGAHGKSCAILLNMWCSEASLLKGAAACTHVAPSSRTSAPARWE